MICIIATPCKLRCFRIEFSVQQKVVFLKDDLKKPERDIIMFNRFPMVSITDCVTNHEVVETLLDHADQDLISNSVGMEHVWFLMDKESRRTHTSLWNCGSKTMAKK